MICIFCKIDSSTSTSVEHIIPECFGNTKNKLPKGIVCDKCNSYFGRKVEQPVLAMAFFEQLRARNAIETKKKKIPSWNIEVYHPEVKSDNHQAWLIRRRKKIPILSVAPEFAYAFLEKIPTKIIVDDLTRYIELPKNNALVSRFIAKMAVEILAQMVIDSGWPIETIIYDDRIDPIRNYARLGTKTLRWEYFIRKVYDENASFYYDYDPQTAVDVLYQYDIFFIDEEMFFCIIIKGYEFTINIGSPYIERYVKWLLLNKSESPIDTNRIISFGSSYPRVYL